MNPYRGNDWTPDPELLAAFVDGEFEGRDDLDSLRGRLEDWLTGNPHAQEELAQYRKLRQLWLASTPPEPTGRAWQAMQANLRRVCGQGRLRPTNRGRRWWLAGVVGIAACLAFLAVEKGGPGRIKNPLARAQEEMEPFPVASEHEVVILRVDGEDAPSLVVGRLPLQGPLEVADRGDVALTSVHPNVRDKSVPELRDRGPGTPMMIWMQTPADKKR